MEAFLTILSLHGVNLSEKDQKTLARKFGSGGNIDFKNALAEVQIDLEFAGVGEQKWTLKKAEVMPSQTGGSVLS
jgi:hypothetical protein